MSIQPHHPLFNSISLTFSAKESLFKALYPLVLRHFYFQDAEVLDVDDSGRLRLRLLPGKPDSLFF